jgi:glutamine amidotransferase
MGKTAMILDYGVGNIGSISSFLKENNYSVSYGNSPFEIKNTDLLILPGVGSFGEAMRNIDKFNMRQHVLERHANRRPILGICLGMQLLTNGSSESPGFEGFGILNGVTSRLQKKSRIGWDFLSPITVGANLEGPYYFNHSYGINDVHGNKLNVDTTDGSCRALIVDELTIGVQFHPEKSQKSGSIFLRWAENEIWGFCD